MSRGSGYHRCPWVGHHRDVRGSDITVTFTRCADNVWFNFLVYHPPPGLHVGKKNKRGDVPVVRTIYGFDGPWVRKALQRDVPGVGTVNSGDVTTIPGGGWDTMKLNQTLPLLVPYDEGDIPVGRDITVMSVGDIPWDGTSLYLYFVRVKFFLI